MADEIFLCLSQENAENPYQFKLTGINVFSLEEAAYHCFAYWKQSIDEFLSKDFLDWIKTSVGLPYMASKIALINDIKSKRDRLIAFLTLFNLYDEIQLSSIKIQLGEWEKRLQWEQFKDQGDYLYKKGEFIKASGYYKSALDMEENIILLNNLALCHMALKNYEKSISVFEKAVLIDSSNQSLILNYCEALIYNRSVEKASFHLEKLDGINSTEKQSEVLFLRGLLCFEENDLRKSLEYFEKAIEIKAEPFYYYKLSDVYIALRRYDKAIETVDKIKVKDKAYYLAFAEINYVSGNISAACKAIEKAMIIYKNDIKLWTKLAFYYRLDYDATKAYSAIAKALSIDNENEEALLEMARIKKALGKTKDYQLTLNKLLQKFKKKYRDYSL